MNVNNNRHKSFTKSSRVQTSNHLTELTGSTELTSRVDPKSDSRPDPLTVDHA
ncbi:hypothetical protein Hanom_Chr00s024709g01763931 [Helianthus anomalus]